MKSCVVGIGAMGLEMAFHIQNKGMDVVGVDLDQKQIAEAKQRGLSASDDLADQVSDIDVFIVIVATDKQT
ncbi:MAG: NAD(P)-binding domain-containing protein, partial [Gammaproteobacteria bacterium]